MTDVVPTPSADLPLERYTKLKLEGCKESQMIFFCGKCDYQLMGEGVPVNECPTCLVGLRFVVNNQKLRDTLKLIGERLDPNKWEANYAVLLTAANERRAKLPKSVREAITATLTDIGGKIKALTPRNHKLDEDELHRRRREVYLTSLVGLIDVAEAMTKIADRSRILTLN